MHQEFRFARNKQQETFYQPKDHCHDEYSFNNNSQTFKNYQGEDQSHQHSEQTLLTNSDLMEKYHSLCDELASVDLDEIIKLLIEEIEENQKNKKIISACQMKLEQLGAEIKQLNLIVEEKRLCIARLTRNQTEHSHLIEQLKLQVSSRKPISCHYKQKYAQLEDYMNEYISNTHIAQQEFTKTMKSLTQSNSYLTSLNQNLSLELNKQNKLFSIGKQKRAKLEKCLAESLGKQSQLQQKIDEYQRQNIYLKKDIDVLIQNMKQMQESDILGNKSSSQRDISSSLDFIREKINGNETSQRQVSKKQQSKEQRFTSNKQQILLQQAKVIQKLQLQNIQLLKDNEELFNSFQRQKIQLETIKSDQMQLIGIIEQKNKYIQKLKASQSQLASKNRENRQNLQSTKENIYFMKTEGREKETIKRQRATDCQEWYKDKTDSQNYSSFGLKLQNNQNSICKDNQKKLKQILINDSLQQSNIFKSPWTESNSIHLRNMSHDNQNLLRTLKETPQQSGSQVNINYV